LDLIQQLSQNSTPAFKQAAKYSLQQTLQTTVQQNSKNQSNLQYLIICNTTDQTNVHIQIKHTNLKLLPDSLTETTLKEKEVSIFNTASTIRTNNSHLQPHFKIFTPVDRESLIANQETKACFAMTMGNHLSFHQGTCGNFPRSSS
jgi:mannose-1-phosphate guanylyltransferase